MSIMAWEEIVRIKSLKSKDVVYLGNKNWTVEKNGWSGLDPHYVTFIIERLKMIFEKWFGLEINKKKIIFVLNKTDEQVPTAFPDHGIISLSRGIKFNDSCRIIYQVSHELCHILLGQRAEYKLSDEYKWFEETICELASQSALNDDIWSSFSSVNNQFTNTIFIKKYLQDIENDIPKLAIPLVAGIYKLEAKRLAADPYMRNLNVIFALTIRNNIEINKSFWDCIKIFTEIDGQAAPKIEDSFIYWYNKVPIDKKEIVAKVIEIFGGQEVMGGY